MSIPVEVEALPDTVARFGPAAFLLTTSDDGRPHATHVVTEVTGAEIRCELGRRTARNGRARSLVSMLWPPTEEGGYSLIVDGELEVVGGDESGEGAVGLVRATWAVLHRPAPVEGAEDAPCGSDCLRIEIPADAVSTDAVPTDAGPTGDATTEDTAR